MHQHAHDRSEAGPGPSGAPQDPAPPHDPAPPQAPASRTGGASRALALPVFRAWLVAGFVSSTGTWMQRTAQDWLVLTVLTHDSGAALGVTTALQFGPFLVVSPLAGALADRCDRRRILIGTALAAATLSGVLGVLVLTGTVRLWHVYVLAALLGVTSAVEGPARQVLVGDLVGPSLLSPAVGLNAASFHTGHVAGPALAGLLIAGAGTGPVFLLDTLSYVGVVAVLLRMRPSRRTPPGAVAAPAASGGAGGATRPPGVPADRAHDATPAAGPGGRVRLGEYLQGRPDLVMMFVAMGLVGTVTLNFELTMALVARLEFDRDAGDFGLLGSAIAVGGVAGALLQARRAQARLQVTVHALAALGLTGVLAALAPAFGWFAVLLVPVGVTSLVLVTSMNAWVQTSSHPQVRGRVMAVHSVMMMGGTPLGAPLMGWIGDVLGARWTIGLGSAFCLVVWAVVQVLVGTGRVRPGGGR